MHPQSNDGDVTAARREDVTEARRKTRTRQRSGAVEMWSQRWDRDMREDILVRRAHVRLREMNIVTMDKPYRLRDIRDGCNGENKENERDKMVSFKKKM